MKKIKADYLVIGTGAVGMTFVDVMLDESDATFVMVDRHHLPGGHWNDAYSFVRLHQPAAYYGVVSAELGSGQIDQFGPNKGYYDLASGPEVLAYFEKLMRERFLPSGRVQYFPMSDYTGNGTFRSLLSGEEVEVEIGRKLVDGTFFKTSVPSTHTPRFDIATDVTCIPPNDLPRRASDFKRFAVLGGGKTAMDSCMWLLDNGANPDHITWVCPRDSWLMNRLYTQPGAAFFETFLKGNLDNIEAMGAAKSVEDLFERMEAAGTMMRIDPTVTPEMFHFATISEGEVEQLQRIKHMIRGQRVGRLDANQMVMESGEVVATTLDTLFIDCTASAVSHEARTTRPIFESDLITLQWVFAPLMTYSAAVIAFVEAHVDSESEKNKLCAPISLPDTPADWMQATLGNMMNGMNWSQNKELNQWLRSCRLNPTAAAYKEGGGKDPALRAIRSEMRQKGLMAVMNTQRLIDQLPEQ